MTNREAMVMLNCIENASIALVHAEEEPDHSIDYMHVAMDWLATAAEYADLRKSKVLNPVPVDDD